MVTGTASPAPARRMRAAPSASPSCLVSPATSRAASGSARGSAWGLRSGSRPSVRRARPSRALLSSRMHDLMLLFTTVHDFSSLLFFLSLCSRIRTQLSPHANGSLYTTSCPPFGPFFRSFFFAGSVFFPFSSAFASTWCLPSGIVWTGRQTSGRAG
jgi:hypothetical protein